MWMVARALRFGIVVLMGLGIGRVAWADLSQGALGSFAPGYGTSCLLGDALASCDPALQPVYNPLAYVHTKDMLLVMAALSILTLAISAVTDDPKVIGTTYSLLGLTGLILMPAAIVYDWIVLLN